MLLKPFIGATLTQRKYKKLVNYKLTMQITQNQFSQSEIVTHDTCPRKWYWQYGKCIKPKGFWNWNFVVGTALHEFLEAFHGRANPQTKGVFAPRISEEVIRDAAWEKKFEFWQTFFPAWCSAYSNAERRYPSQIKALYCEKLITREYQDIIFTGKIDLAIEDRVNHICDHKTMSNLEVYGNALKTRFQFLFYFWLSGLLSGKFTVNKIKKPALRQGKNEPDFEFTQRCVEDVLDPSRAEAYFGRETIVYTEDDMANFEIKVMGPKIKILKRLLQSNPDDNFLWTNMGMHSCYNYNSPCAFISLCFEDEALAAFYFESKTSKHEELEETE